MTLDVFKGMYATGFAETPMTTATGCVDGVAAMLSAVAMTEATLFLTCLLTASTVDWVRGLYVVALGKSLGQFTERWDTKTRWHFKHPSLSKRSFRSISNNLGRGTRPEAEDDEVLLFILARREGSVRGLLRLPAS